LGRKNLSLDEVRTYLHNISEAIEQMSKEELHVSGEKDRFYLLTKTN